MEQKWDRERADHKGLFKMYKDKQDNTDVFQSHRVVNEIANYKYIASITYTAIPFDTNVKKLIRWCPDDFFKVIMKNPKSYGAIHKTLNINQVTDDNIYSVSKSHLEGTIMFARFINENELSKYLLDFIDQRFPMDSVSYENRIVRLANSKFNLYL